MSANPLVTFVYDTFGRQFGDLLLTGYGAQPGGARRRLYLTESADGVEAYWVVNLVTRRLPCRDEPLVAAALLKLLLSRPSISQYMKFDLGELLTLLRWRDDASTRRRVEAAIGHYVRLLYDKQVDTRAGKRPSAREGGGYYHLLTGYVREDKSGAGASLPRASREVYFDSGLIKGLKQGRVCFAGIDFGEVF